MEAGANNILESTMEGPQGPVLSESLLCAQNYGWQHVLQAKCQSHSNRQGHFHNSGKWMHRNSRRNSSDSSASAHADDGKARSITSPLAHSSYDCCCIISPVQAALHTVILWLYPVSPGGS